VYTAEEAQLGLVDVIHIGHILEVVCINKYIYSVGLSGTRGNIQYPMPRQSGMGPKIACAIFRNGRCDFAKRDMRFFIMAGAIFDKRQLRVIKSC
jgi:hypothetical protein